MKKIFESSELNKLNRPAISQILNSAAMEGYILDLLQAGSDVPVRFYCEQAGLTYQFKYEGNAIDNYCRLRLGLDKKQISEKWFIVHVSYYLSQGGEPNYNFYNEIYIGRQSGYINSLMTNQIRLINLWKRLPQFLNQ